MSKKNTTMQFFSDLEQVSAELVGADSPVCTAAKNAVKNPSPTAFYLAQEELARLSEDVRESILEALHCRMRNDLEAIWDNLPNNPRSGRPN